MQSVINYLLVATRLTLLVCSVACMNFQENPCIGTPDTAGKLLPSASPYKVRS